MNKALIVLLIFILSTLACRNLDEGRVPRNACEAAKQHFELNPNEATAGVVRDTCWEVQPD